MRSKKSRNFAKALCQNAVEIYIDLGKLTIISMENHLKRTVHIILKHWRIGPQ